jgi:hypothetical protein
VKSITKFAAADHDRSATLDPVEFATTAVKRRPGTAPPCATPAPAAREDD